MVRWKSNGRKLHFPLTLLSLSSHYTIRYHLPVEPRSSSRCLPTLLGSERSFPIQRPNKKERQRHQIPIPQQTDQKISVRPPKLFFPSWTQANCRYHLSHHLPARFPRSFTSHLSTLLTGYLNHTAVSSVRAFTFLVLTFHLRKDSTILLLISF